jgi:hypothetical protein
MRAELEQTSFLGRGWSFPPIFDKNAGDVRLVSDIEDIQQSLQILFTTIPNERFLQPNYGCDMTPMVFEPIDLSNLTYMKMLINNAILYFEPRIKPEKLELNPDLTNGIVLIDLTYFVMQTNTRYNMVFPYYLKEGSLNLI